MALLRERAVLIYPFLDDCLGRNACLEQLVWGRDRTLQILQEAGFIINLKKSHLTPSQDLTFIGAHFRTDLGMVYLPCERAQALAAYSKTFRVGSYKTAREYMRFLGFIASTLEVVPHARLRMRPLQLYLLSKWRPVSEDYNAKIMVKRDLLPHLQWWQSLSNLRKGVRLNPLPVDITVTTDASMSGWGGHTAQKSVQGTWSPHDRLLHINILEMKAVALTLKALCPLLQGKHLLIRTDNTSVLNYINHQGGVKSPSLCLHTWSLLLWCQEHQISLEAIHIAGVDNVLADTLSRTVSKHSEWSLRKGVVHQIFHHLGTPNIDLFATKENSKLQVFCSWKWDPQAYHQDALSLQWGRGLHYAYPPLDLLPMVIQKACRENASLILIAPWWPKRSWFPGLLMLLSVSLTPL
jgi:hypothetical protein